MKTLPWENYRHDNWDNWRLKFAAPLTTDRGNQDLQQLEYLGMENVESWTGKLVRTELNNEVNEEKDTLQSTGIAFDSYHVLFGKLRPYLAKVFLPNSSGICSTEFLVLEPIKSINRKYLFYTLLTKEFIATVNASTFGSKMPRANWDFIGSQSVPVPPISEQNKIVNYLDRETTQIDNLIAAKEQMLTLLEEKREALISHAVTRGLDPNVAFKRSGLDWLGDIPQHWQFCQIRRLSPVKRGASPRPIDDLKYFDDDGEFSWVRISDVTASRKYLTQTTEKLSVLGSSLSVKLYPETFFVSIAASVGKPIITKIKCCIHDGFVYFPYLRINNNFLYYLFEGGQLFKGLGKLGTQLNLNTETIGSIHIPIPPDDEIEMIVDFLEYETAKIDKLVAAIKDSIVLLKERRSALITAAVTGQIALEEMTP